MRLVLLNEATASKRRVYFHLVDATDGLTAETGEGSGQPQISTNGATFTNTGIGTLTHIGNGRYYADLTQTAVNGTAGDVIETRYKSANTAEAVGDSFIVAAIDIFAVDMGLSNVSANIEQISGDSVAADNLESQYDTTGLSGDTFPASQGQISAISASGSFNNETADSYVLTTGTQSANTFSDTAPLDGVRHEHTDDAGAMELEYETNVGAGSAVSAKITGYLQSSNDSLGVYAWDWVASAWKQRETMSGQALASNSVLSVDLLSTDTGTGSDKGRVRLRLYAASGLTSATLAIDQLLFGFNQSSGAYEGGAVWIDTGVSNTGTTVGVDGISTNPVSTLAAARTIALATNLKRFTVMSGSDITLANTYNGYLFEAHGVSIHLGGQDITNCHFFGAEVDGIATASGGEQHFHDCDFETTATFPANTTFDACSFGGTATIGEAGDYYLFGCNSRVAGSGTPTWDMGAAIGGSDVSVRKYSGGWTINNIAAGDTMSVGGTDMGTVTLNGADGTVDIRGTGKPAVDNRTGSPTLTRTGYMNTAAVDTELTAQHGSGSWASGGLTGANAVTVTVEDELAAAVVGAVVAVYNATNTGSVLDQKTTDPSGQVSFSMDAGTYKLRIVKSGIAFTQPETIIVVTDPDVFTITGTNVTIGSPTQPNGCVLTGDLQDIGIGGSASVINVKYITPQRLGDIIGVGTIVTTTADSAGHFEIEVAQGATVDLEIDDGALDIRFVVPSASSYNIKNEVATVTS